MTEKRTILILEDDDETFNRIRKYLEEHFRHDFDIFPLPDTETKSDPVTYQAQGSLVDAVQGINSVSTDFIQTVLGDFRPDVIIVDKAIHGSDDSLGFDFADQLLKVHPTLKQIRISKTMPISTETAAIKFVDKALYGIGKSLVQEVGSKLKEQFPDLTVFKPTSENNLQNSTAQNEQNQDNKWEHAVEWIRGRPFVLFLDPIIHIVFYALVLFSILIAVFSIGSAFRDLVVGLFEKDVTTGQISKPKNTAEANSNMSLTAPQDATKIEANPEPENAITDLDKPRAELPEKKKEVTNRLLIVAETIFLGFLPFLILLGLFNYYQKSIGLSLRGNESRGIDEEATARTMNLSKTLFITSLISYVFIKTIEAIFNDSVVQVSYRWLAYGTLLLLLIGYLLVINLSSHRKPR